MKKLFSLIALLCLCVSGAWATVTSYTWDFTNTTTWTTAKVSTGSAVTLNPSGATPGAGEYGVTFNFTENEGGQVKQNNASNSVYGTYFWFFKAGSASAENVAITVPAGFQVTFDVFASSSRLIKYNIDGGNEASLSSNVLVYDNTTANPVIITLWANNPINNSGNSNNAIKRITLKDYTNADKYTCTLNAVATINGIKTTIKSATYPNLFEEKDYTVSSSKVISYGGKYYEQENSATMTNFSKTYTMGHANEVREINYVLAPDIEYYAEGEDLNSKAVSQGITYSGGANTSYITKLKESSILSGGNYTITISLTGRNGKTDFNIYDSSDNLLASYPKGSQSVGLKVFDPIAVNPGENVKFGINADTFNNSCSIDFVLIRKVSSNATMSAAGYTTFSSTSNIDADAIVGGKAYVINAFNAENVVLTPATGIVPANTGMIIAGEGGAAASAGTVTIPVSTADATFDASSNLLVACATATTVQAAAAGKKNYVLAYDAADAANTIGFYYIGSTSATVAAGKAYLTVDEATPAKMFRFSTGNTTGIKAVSNEITANKAVKRIMNGQLVIEKAGKMFNAAGAQMK